MATDIQKKEQRWQTIGALIGIGLLAFVVSPFIMATIKGLLGLVTCMIIAGISWKFLPWFSMKIANLRLKAIKAEASANPIETLQNQLIEKCNGLAQFKSALASFKGEIELFTQKFADFCRKFPGNTTAITQNQQKLDKMNQLYVLRVGKYQATAKALADFKDRIDWAQGEWEMAQAAAQMQNSAGVTGDQFLSQIAEDTAFSAVQKAVADSFAEIDVAFLDEAQSQITTPQVRSLPSVVITSAQPKALPDALSSLALDDLVESRPTTKSHK